MFLKITAIYFSLKVSVDPVTKSQDLRNGAVKIWRDMNPDIDFKKNLGQIGVPENRYIVFYGYFNDFFQQNTPRLCYHTGGIAGILKGRALMSFHVRP